MSGAPGNASAGAGGRWKVVGSYAFLGMALGGEVLGAGR